MKHKKIRHGFLLLHRWSDGISCLCMMWQEIGSHDRPVTASSPNPNLFSWKSSFSFSHSFLFFPPHGFTCKCTSYIHDVNICIPIWVFSPNAYAAAAVKLCCVCVWPPFISQHRIRVSVLPEWCKLIYIHWMHILLLQKLLCSPQSLDVPMTTH